MENLEKFLAKQAAELEKKMELADSKISERSMIGTLVDFF